MRRALASTAIFTFLDVFRHIGVAPGTVTVRFQSVERPHDPLVYAFHRVVTVKKSLIYQSR